MTEATFVRIFKTNDLRHANPSGDFTVVCLWAALGLAMTALVCSLGFAAEIGAALASG